MRNAFVEEVSSIFFSSERVALLLGDIGSFGFRRLLEEFPDRALNLGILEQSMIGVGAGLASEGMVPIIHTIAPFLVERSLEQIKVDFGYQSLAGNLVSVGSSYDYSSLGCTHHCPADINLLHNIPGVNIFVPGHVEEFRNNFRNEWNNKKLNYFRLAEKSNKLFIDVKVGEARKITSGKAATIIVIGPILDNVLDSISGLDVEVHYTNSISSSYKLKLDSSFLSSKLIIIEPYYSGALLQQMQEQLESRPLQILQIGVPKEFIRKYGTREELTEHLQLDSRSLRKRIESFLYQ